MISLVNKTYIAIDPDGTYDAFVAGRGFAANTTLPEALAFIREHTGRTSGPVDCFDRASKEWTSEMELAVDA